MVLIFIKVYEKIYFFHLLSKDGVACYVKMVTKDVKSVGENEPDTLLPYHIWSKLQCAQCIDNPSNIPLYETNIKIGIKKKKKKKSIVRRDGEEEKPLNRPISYD